MPPGTVPAGKTASGRKPKPKPKPRDAYAFERSSPTAFNQPTNWANQLASGNIGPVAQATQNAANTAPFGPSGGRNNGGGGGGGGSAGPNLAQVRGLADTLFTVNRAPYLQQIDAINRQREAANAYNPDFGAMQAQYNAANAQAEQQRQQALQQSQARLTGVGQTLAGQSTGAMQAGLRDLSAQGVNVNPYLQQVSSAVADRTGMLSNQAQYLGQLDQAALERNAGYQQMGNQLTLGAQGQLANNRGTLLNQLGQNQSQIELQAAQAQAAQDQAKQAFLLKYGMV